ncbi:MAG TPA: riboflavin synthase [Planctomycetota bacterium]|nr:riboflavin synthase [Planctomycetota bacterium]
MFTGIVEACVAVRRVERRGRGARLVVPAPGPGWEVGVGDSVAVSGVCLTLAGRVAAEGAAARSQGEREEGDLLFDLSAETLSRTRLGGVESGELVNLERSLRIGDRVGGHLVAGHVDGLARVVEVRESGDGGKVLVFEVESGLERYLVEKGSVALDGVSLTVVEPRGRRFQVAVIPVTLERTSLGVSKIGARVHVEADLIGKWVERFVVQRLEGGRGA